MGFKTYTCPIFRECGGCEWLAVPYPIQLRRKREQVADLFAGLIDADSIEIHGMDDPTGFRHKAATPFAPRPKGRVACGFYAKGTHDIVACKSCLTEDPRCRDILNSIGRLATKLHIAAYDEDRGTGILRHAIVRAGWATDELLVTLVTNGGGLRGIDRLVPALLDEHPQITAVAQNVQTKKTNAILGRESQAIVGEGIMHDSLLGVTFEIGPDSFYQTNPAQTEVLYSLAIEGAGLRGGDRLLDAYCGIGTIGLCAAAQVDGLQVVGVEKTVGAVECAKRNAQAAGLSDRVRFVPTDATAWMRDVAGHQHFDVVIMDPPRAGSTQQFIDGLAAVDPKTVVYVSCNPTTQRRDIDMLGRHGYRLTKLDVVDMFPHTKHAETVALLSR